MKKPTRRTWQIHTKHSLMMILMTEIKMTFSKYKLTNDKKVDLATTDAAPLSIAAHDSALACITLNTQGGI